MLTVLRSKRHALAVDVTRSHGCAVHKNNLCSRSTALLRMPSTGMPRAGRCRPAAQSNRRVRNLIAANVAARLDAMTGHRRSIAPMGLRPGSAVPADFRGFSAPDNPAPPGLILFSDVFSNLARSLLNT
jgi:hypothetical protein